MAALEASTRIVTSVLTLLESERAFVRAESSKLIAPADCARLRGMLASASRAWLLMQLSDEVRSRAAQRFPIEPVRTLDAIHLATALVFVRGFPDLRVLSLDTRILDNAEALGLSQ
jgi:hypothetical protein